MIELKPPLCPLLHKARAELACPRCSNRGRVMMRGDWDECPECHGDPRNTSTIELLEQLAIRVDQLEGLVRP